MTTYNYERFDTYVESEDEREFGAFPTCCTQASGRRTES
jgi:hypothetical protein